MIKKIFLALLLLVTSLVSAQSGTASPYSYYGIGDIKFNGTQDSKMMGGLAIAVDSIHLNFLNPASYSKLKVASFGVGATTSFNKFSNGTLEEKAKRTTIDYLAIGFPISKKFGASFGLMPYSHVGYNIQDQVEQVTDGLVLAKRYNGEGGTNRVFLGTGYNLSENLSLGVELNYYFGKIDTKSIVFATEPSLVLGTRELNTSKLNGMSYNLGMYYNKMINKKYSFSTSFVFTPESKLSSDNSRNIALILYNQLSGAETSYSAEDTRDINVSDTKIVLPSKYSIGLGFGQNKKWFLGAEYTGKENSKFTNRFVDISGATFKNANKFAIGGYIIPKYNSFSNYWERIAYRAGVRFENTGLVLNNTEVKDYGMNFGLGLPSTNSFSNLNIGFEFGKKGVTTNGLIQENYFNLYLGLSLNDIWFQKRKYD